MDEHDRSSSRMTSDVISTGASRPDFRFEAILVYYFVLSCIPVYLVFFVFSVYILTRGCISIYNII